MFNLLAAEGNCDFWFWIAMGGICLGVIVGCHIFKKGFDIPQIQTGREEE